MSRQFLRRLVWIPAGVLFIAGSAVLAQTALTDLKVTEAAARECVLETFRWGTIHSDSAGSCARVAYSAYAKVPAAARGPVTTGLYAWTKAYLNTPAFKTAYAAIHKERTPDPFKPPVNTVDEELKPQLESMRKMGVKESPELVKQMRTNIEEERARKKATHEAAVKEWQELYPADPMVVVARALRGFLNNTADVDFAAKVATPAGFSASMLVGFVNTAYDQKPWQWRLSFMFGAETTAAARAAAAAWLKELPVK